MRDPSKPPADFRQINPRTEPRRFATLVIVGTVIGGVAGAPILRFLLGLFGVTLP